ncbi:hypothetical protein [Micromonospora aurantiaca (nom. illeg.)]|uniref:hypothetical protein n=1 Tax=Micromonospora aurantiaca (nom. illeg.) TaxID=47850 RepID=UPI001648FE31|nr:hypothetical protein [Micromonospora aurantiaca]MBC9000452.1 hypothetical protein [Micromonospora aurantiaca]
MSYPPNLAPVTVNATYKLADDQGGTPAAGTVTFRLRDTVQVPADDLVLIPKKVDAELVDGQLQVELPSVASPAVSPAGVTWWVVERITGAQPRTYDIHLPPGPATVNLADLAPATPSRGTVSYVLAAQVGQPDGVAPLGPDGLVPAKHLPAGGGGPGGGGAVDSVDGLTGAVDLSDRYLAKSARGQAGGVASLDGSGRLPAAQLPPITAGQVGAAPAVHSHDDRYYTESEVDVALASRAPADHAHPYVPTSAVGVAGGVAPLDGSGRLLAAQLPALTAADVGAAPSVHQHDDRYYTEVEVDAALAGKAPTHAHPYVPVVEKGTAGGVATLDGSGQLTASQLPAITAADVGAAPAVHDHDDRYPTETEVAEALATKAEDVHSHPGYVPTSTVGVEGGPAGPLVGGVLPTSQLPALAITDVFTVASEAEMLALAAQRGDVAIRTDLPGALILAADPPSALASWKQLPTPADAVLSVNGRTGVVVLAAADVGAAATDHTHTPAEIGAATAGHTHTAAQVGAAAAGHGHTAAEVGAAAAAHSHTAAQVGAAAASHTHSPAEAGAAPASHTHSPAEAGAAAASHSHPASDIGSGTLAVARLPDATTGTRGIVQLAGDLAGTAAAPTVPGLGSRPTVRLWNGTEYQAVTGAVIYIGGSSDPTVNPGDIWIQPS